MVDVPGVSDLELVGRSKEGLAKIKIFKDVKERRVALLVSSDTDE